MANLWTIRGWCIDGGRKCPGRQGYRRNWFEGGPSDRRWWTKRRRPGAGREVWRRQNAISGSQVRGIVRRAIRRIFLHNPTTALLYDPTGPRPFASGPEVPACPFSLSTADLRWSGGNETGRPVGPCDHVHCFRANANGVGYADEDTTYNTNTPDKELAKSSRSLMDCDIQGVELKLEEDSWSAPTMIDLAGVVGNTVLVCT